MLDVLREQNLISADEAGIALAMYGASLLAFASAGALAVAGFGSRRLAAAAAA